MSLSHFYHIKWGVSYKGSIYTIPNLDTIAGVEKSKLSDSKIIVILLVKGIIWLLGKHSFFVSSRTVFKLSIHKESTGPSKSIQKALPLVSLVHFYTILPKTPSCHSWVYSPYNCSKEMDFGFILYIIFLSLFYYFTS